MEKDKHFMDRDGRIDAIILIVSIIGALPKNALAPVFGPFCRGNPAHDYFIQHCRAADVFIKL